MRTLLLSLASAAILAAPPARADDGPGIAELAPPGAFGVAWVADWTSMAESLSASNLGELWREPTVQKFFEYFRDKLKDEMEEDLAGLELEFDDFAGPAGHAGVALFPREGEFVEMNVLAAADFGDRAAQVDEALARALDRAVADGSIEISEEEFRGATVTTIVLVDRRDELAAEAEAADEDMGDDGMGDDEFGGFEPDAPASPFAWITELTLARLDGWFILGTDAEAVEDAVRTATGDRVDSLADSEDYQATLAQHPPDSAAFAAVIMTDVWEPISRWAGESYLLPPDVDARAVLDGLGLAGIRSVSMGYRVDAGDAILDQSIGVLAPQKRGLLALAGVGAGPFEAPAFVGPDAAQLVRYTFDFPGLIPLAREVVALFPDAQRPQLSQALDQAEGVAGPLLDAMGPDIFMASSFTRPLSATSQSNVVAIRVSDPDMLTNLITAFGAGVLEPSDFEGNPIFRPGDAGFFPMSVGVGFGYVFMGAGEDVENAMRQAANPAAARLATEPGFAAATGPLGQQGSWYGFSDITQQLDWMTWSMLHEGEIQRQSLIAAGLDPADFAELLTEPEDWVELVPPAEVMGRHLGDTVWEFTSTDDGFRGRSYLWRPRAD